MVSDFDATIFVMPESADSGELIRVMLEAPGRHVLVAGEGVDVFDVGRAVALDVVISELSPPLLRGIDMVVRLQALQPNIGVLFVSAWYDHPSFPELREPLLRKPFSQDQLLRALAGVLERGRSRVPRSH